MFMHVYDDHKIFSQNDQQCATLILELTISQLLLDILRGTTIEPSDKRLVFIVQTGPHHNHWLVLIVQVSTCCLSARPFNGLLSMCSVVEKLPWNSTEIKNCSET
jgi:hypothetical protein